MGYYLYQLAFDGPVHFGDTSMGGNLEQSGFTYTSDTLFSSICTELAQQGAADLLDEFIALGQKGEILLSDLLPYQYGTQEDLELFLPAPYIYINNNRQQENLDYAKAKALSAQRKKAKKQLYYRASELYDYVEALKNGETYIAKYQLQLGDEFITEKVNCRGELPMPYFMKSGTFADNAGLYLVVKLPDAWADNMKEILTMLGLSGIGGKRSSGYGHFHLADNYIYLDERVYCSEFDDIAAMNELLQNLYNWQMSISSILPREKELELVKSGSYQLKKSSGFASGIKRDSVYMLSAGSCFTEKLQGSMVDLATLNEHSVWRYGKGLFVGLNI